MDEAGATEVDDLHFAAGVRLDEDVLWFEVTVDQLQVMDKGEGVEDLLGDPLKSGHIEVPLLLHFSIVL